MTQNQAVLERGEKLRAVDVKAGEMRNAAEDYRRATKELLKQQQQKKTGWGIF